MNAILYTYVLLWMEIYTNNCLSHGTQCYLIGEITYLKNPTNAYNSLTFRLRLSLFKYYYNILRVIVTTPF